MSRKEARTATEIRESRMLCAMYFAGGFIAPLLIKPLLDYSNRNLATDFTTNSFNLLLLQAAVIGGMMVAAFLHFQKGRLPSEPEMGLCLMLGAFLGEVFFSAIFKWTLK